MSWIHFQRAKLSKTHPKVTKIAPQMVPKRPQSGRKTKHCNGSRFLTLFLRIEVFLPLPGPTRTLVLRTQNTGFRIGRLFQIADDVAPQYHPNCSQNASNMLQKTSPKATNNVPAHRTAKNMIWGERKCAQKAPQSSHNGPRSLTRGPQRDSKARSKGGRSRLWEALVGHTTSHSKKHDLGGTKMCPKGPQSSHDGPRSLPRAVPSLI